MTSDISQLSNEQIRELLGGQKPVSDEEPVVETPVSEATQDETPEKEIGLDGLSTGKIRQLLGFEPEEKTGLVHEIIKSTPDIAKEGLRQHMIANARINESLLGNTGNILDFAADSSLYIFEEMFGYSPKMRELLYGEDFANVGSGALGFALGAKIPTTEDLRDITKSLTGEELEPKNAFEARIQEIWGDFGAALAPGGTLGKVSLGRTLGTVIGSNLSAEGLKQLDFGEGAQTAGKIGTMFLMGLMSQESARNYSKRLLSEAEEAIPSGASVNARGLIRRNNEIIRELDLGIETAGKAQIEKIARQINEKTVNGTLSLKEGFQINRDLNELIFDIAGGPEELARARRLLLPLKSNLHETINAAKDDFPEVIGLWQDGNRAYAGVSASNKVSDFISRQGKDYRKLDQNTKALLGATGAGASLTGSAVAAIAEIIHQVSSDPVLSKFYAKTLSAALNENQAGFIKQANNLDKALKRKNELQRKKRERDFKKAGGQFI